MTISQFLSLVEIKTKIVSVSTFFIALLFALLQGYTPAPWQVALLFAAVLMVDMGTTGFNSFFDFVKGVDHSSLNREKEKVLVHEKVPAGLALLISLGLYAAAGCIGLYFIAYAGLPVLYIGLASFAVGILYSGGPRPISHSPFGELFAGGFLGGVLFVVLQFIFSRHAPAQWGQWILLALPSSAIIASILTVNNTCDLDADRQAGRRTLSILIGRRASIILLWFLVSAAYAGMAILCLASYAGLHPAAASFLAAAYVAACIRLRGMQKSGFSQERKGPSMGGISAIFLWFSLASLAAAGLSLILSHF